MAMDDGNTSYYSILASFSNIFQQFTPLSEYFNNPPWLASS